MNEITMLLAADKFIKMALEEDINSEDVTTNSVMPHYKKGQVELICKEDGIVAGLQVFQRVFQLLDPKTEVVFDVQDLFIGASLEDVAVLDRFNKIPLHPEEVYPKWIEWAKNNFVQIVVDYLTAYPDRSYDISPAVDKAHDYDRTDDLVPAYPTFRAWENISDYLKTLDDKKFSVDIINGLLGEKNGAKFMNYLKLNGYSSKYLGKSGTEEHLDQLTDFVSDSLDAGLPTMVMGVSGLGKTTRIREYCQKNGYDFELISLFPDKSLSP